MSFNSRPFQITISLIVLFTLAASVIQPPSASAQAQDDDIERQYNTETGRVSMISGEGNLPITILGAMEAGMSDEQRADALAQSFAPEFGVTDPVSDLYIAEQDQVTSNRVTTKYQQTYNGIPVIGGELMINASEQGALYSMNGEVAQGLDLDTTPAITAEEAADIALQAMAKWHQSEPSSLTVQSGPELWIFDESLLRPSARPAELVWRMEVVSADQSQPINEFMLVNAKNGNISLHFNQIDTGWHAASADPGINQPPQQEETITPTITEVHATETPVPTETIEPVVTTQPTITNVPTIDPFQLTPTPEFLPTPEDDDLNAQAGTWYVNIATGNNGNSCTTELSPCKNIQQTIDKASSGDTIKVASGTYMHSGNVQGWANVVIIDKSLTLSGGWDSSFTTQSGVSIVDGQYTTAPSGNNGILTTTGGTVVIENFIVQNAYSGSGAGVYLVDGNVTLQKVTLKNNLAPNVGGGIYVALNVDSLTIINSTITGNTSQNPTSGGGGIHSASAPGIITIKNSTIAYNTASQGGGIHQSLGTFNIVNSIIGNNTATTSGPDCYGTLASVHYSIMENMSGCTITTGSNNLNVDPQINSTLTGTMQVHAPLPGSPARNNGDPDQPDDCQLTDQEGTSRPQGSGCDRGAVEYVSIVGPTLNVLSGSGQLVPPNASIESLFVLQAFDAYGEPASGVEVTFTAPGSDSSGVFSDTGTNVTTTTTNASGIATSPAFTSNGTEGTFNVDATASGFTTATFQVTISDGWFVSTTGSSTANFMCNVSTSPCSTINNVLGNPAFLPGDTISVAAGSYPGFAIAANKNAVISGGWNSTYTAQNAATMFGHIDISANSVIKIMDANIVGSGVMNGGGIHNSGSLVLERVAIYDSWAYLQGGAIYQDSGELDLVNVTISGNLAYSNQPGANSGGGIYVDNGSVTINNSTITQNRTSDDNGLASGGGVANPNNQSITITNSIIAGNISESGPDCAGSMSSGGHNLIGTSSGCSIISQTGDKIGPLDATALAKLGNLQFNSGVTKTHALTPGSFALDTGNPATCDAIDQRGVSRPQGAACDIGAFEGSEAQSATVHVRTYTASNSALTLYYFRCDETDPTCSAHSGNTHVVSAHQYAIGTYNFYLNKHGRQSIDNNNMAILSTVRYQPESSSYDNAFWNGDQMVYGNARDWPLADDVVAHEYTHGVTQYESGLFYFYQSGAINESFSDLWGEYYDQNNGMGTDLGYEWLVGEDTQSVAGMGTLRSMSHPPQFGDPDKMTSLNYVKTIDDSGGVHSNSGVNNKAVYLMVDGGSFNNKTVTGIGWEKTAAIYYEVNTNLLTSGSDYSDLYFALQQACASLALINFKGITTANCVQVKNAIDAVEMNMQPVAGFNPDALACPAGNSTSPVLNIFGDSFENGIGSWTLNNSNWLLLDNYATSGTHMIYGNDQPASSTSTLTTTNGIVLPPGTSYLSFKHAFAFEYFGTEYYDGGVLEYSINNGSTWLDASPMFTDGKNYGGVIFNHPGSSNTLKGRNGFVADSHGYVSSRYNLTPLGGKTVKFRWQFATDQIYGYWGWTIDDIKVYTCVTAPSIPGLQAPAANALSTTYTPFLNWSDATPNVYRYQIQVDTNSSFTAPVVDEANVMVSQFNVLSPLTPNTTYYWRVRAFNQLNETKGWSAASSFRTSLVPPNPLTPAHAAVLLSNRPTFDWSDVLDTTNYTFQASTSSTFATLLINTTVNGSVYTSTIDLPVGQTIYWRVLSNGANGPSAPSSARTVITANPPSIPALSAPADNGLTTDYTPTLDWANSTIPAGVTFDHYQLQVATDAAFTSIVEDEDITGISNSQFTFPTDLIPNTKYFWRVRSYNSLNQTFNWSPVRSFRTALLPPINSAPANTVQINNNRPVFDWDDVPGATGYTLQVSMLSNFSTFVLNTAASASTFVTTTDLPANATLYWRVLANGTNGPSAPSAYFTLTTANAPSTPTLSSPLANALVTTYLPKLDWANSTFPMAVLFDHYEVQIATNSSFTASLESHDVTGVGNSEYTFLSPLNPNTTYFWRVRSFNTLGHYSNWSSTFSFRTVIEKPVLQSPANTTNPPLLTNRPTFDWDDVPGASNYTIQVSTANTFATFLINTTAPASTYTPAADLPAGTVLFWRVIANGANGPSLLPTAFTFKTANPPSVPAPSTPADNALVTNYTPILDWANSTLPSGVVFDHYHLQVATDAAFTSIVQEDDITGITNSQFTFGSALNPNTKYYWRVRSFADGDPNPDPFSGWSATRSFRTVIEKPILVSPSGQLSTNRPTFDWDDVPGASNYTIQVSTANTFATFLINTTAAASTYTPTTDLTAGATLHWRVIANGANGPSLASTASTFTTANPPSVPVLSTPADNALVTNYLPTLDWANSTAPVSTTFDKYQLQLATDAAFTANLQSFDTAAGDITDSDFTFSSPLSPNTKYFWRVRSFNSLGHFSGWSATRSFRAVITTPSLVSPSGQLGTNRPTFDWDDVPGASNYTIQVSSANTFAILLINTTAATSTYTPTTDLPAGQTLYWRVIANGTNGPSLIPTAFSIITANPPSVPALSTPADNALTTDYTPTLDWANSTLPAGTTFDKYQLQLATDAAFTANLQSFDTTAGNIADSSFTFGTDLNPNTKYFWRVRSYNSLGHFSGWSTARSFRAAVITPVLQSPVNAEVLLTNRPTFDWDDVPGASNYTIQVSSANTFAILLINTTAATSTYTPTTDLPAGQTLYWRVIANGTNGPSLIPTAFSIITANPPSVPALSTPADNALTTDYTPTLDWANSTLPAGTTFDKYQLQLATDAAFTANLQSFDTTAGSIADSSFTFGTDLNPNTKYFWRVRSYNTLGGFSTWSATRSFRTALPSATLVSPVNVEQLMANTALIFDWDDVPGATNYTIQVSTANTFATFLINTTANLSAYTYTGTLPANSTLYWRVYANGTNGPSASSAISSILTANPPSVPTLSTPLDNALVTTYQPKLDWANSTFPVGAPFDKYQLQVATDAAFTASVQSFDIAGVGNSEYTFASPLDPNVKYYWRVRSVNISGHYSAWSAARSFRSVVLTPTLTAPVNATQLLVNAPVTFDWDDVPGATNYTIQVSTANTFATFLINTTAGLSTYTHTTNLPTGTTLYWRVIANGANGPSLPSSVRTLITANPPSAPTASTPADNALLTTYLPKLDWANSTVPTGTTFDKYQLQVATDLGFSANLQSFDVSGVNNSEYTFASPLNPNTKYYWRVRGVNTLGHYSAWSTVRSFRTLISTPTGLTPTGSLPISNLKPTFDWDDVAGATNYTIQISTTNTFSSFVVNTTAPASTFTPTANLPSNTALYWRVIANGLNGPSSPAPYLTITLE